MSGCRMEGSSKRIGRCLALVILLAALLASSLAHAQQQQQLPVTEIAPGLFVHIGVIALMTRENEGAIANVGFVVGNDAAECSPRKYRRVLIALWSGSLYRSPSRC